MEQEQFKQEILPLRGQLFGYAGRLLDDRDDAEDVVQEVFLKLWYMREELGRYENVAALATTMTKHLSLNRLKVRERKQEEWGELMIVHEAPSPHTLLEEKDTVAQVMRIIDQLPDLQQTVLRMKHVDCLEVEEIAQLIGATLDAVRMNLSRARRRVKDIYSQMEHDGTKIRTY